MLGGRDTVCDAAPTIPPETVDKDGGQRGSPRFRGPSRSREERGRVTREFADSIRGNAGLPLPVIKSRVASWIALHAPVG